MKKIRLIDVNQKLEKINSTEYKTINGQTFQGRMEGDKMKLGIYTWPNKQQFKGDFDDNQIKKGEIIFYPFNNKLIGTYNILKESLKIAFMKINHLFLKEILKEIKFMDIVI